MTGKLRALSRAHGTTLFTTLLTAWALLLGRLSGDEEVRLLNGKHYSNERLLQFLSALERRRLPIFVYFSLNLPGETEHSLAATIDLARQIVRSYPPELVTIANMLHTIDPESAFSSTNLQGIEMGQMPTARSVGFQFSVTP